jgi:hypothetical protein
MLSISLNAVFPTPGMQKQLIVCILMQGTACCNCIYLRYAGGRVGEYSDRVSPPPPDKVNAYVNIISTYSKTTLHFMSCQSISGVTMHIGGKKG